jgi:PD-(D/E)XK nuclease superfamily
MTRAWKKNLASLPSLLEKKEFRNGVRAVSASSIGTQYFCEMKLDQSYIHGDIETEEKTEGDVLHEELLAMEPTTQKTLLEDIEKRRIVVASFPLAAEAEGLILIGVPDAVIFQSGKPTHIVELKTTRGSASILYDGQRAQAIIYGLLLDQVGFDCTGLNLVVVKFSRQTPISGQQKSQFLDALTSALISNKSLTALASKADGNVVPHSFPYRKAEAVGILNSTRGFWLNQREARATSNPNKCRACEFRSVCPSSLARD